MELIILLVRLIRWMASDRTAQQQPVQLTPEQVRRILAARAAAAKGAPAPAPAQTPQRQSRPGQPAMMKSPPVRPPQLSADQLKRVRADAARKAAAVKKAGGRRPALSSVAVAAPILTPVAAAEPTVTQMVAAAIKPVVPVKPAATAGSIKKWLTPATLRQQFILTEVLRPPMALRDQVGGGPG